MRRMATCNVQRARHSREPKRDKRRSETVLYTKRITYRRLTVYSGPIDLINTRLWSPSDTSGARRCDSQWSIFLKIVFSLSPFARSLVRRALTPNNKPLMAKLCAHISIFRRSACSAHPLRAEHHSARTHAHTHATNAITRSTAGSCGLESICPHSNSAGTNRSLTLPTKRRNVFISQSSPERNTSASRNRFYLLPRGARCHI